MQRRRKRRESRRTKIILSARMAGFFSDGGSDQSIDQSYTAVVRMHEADFWL